MISCANHDYVEIACLYRLSLSITLKNAKQIKGQAKTTLTDNDKIEYLVLESGGESINIELDDIKKMQALTSNPHFQSVEF